MAVPLLLPLLFTAGSVAANSIAANQQARAQADAMSAERRRQRQLDREAMAVNQQSRERYDDVQGQTDQRSTDLAQTFTEALDQAPARPIAALPQTSSNLVMANDQAEASSARADAEDNAMRMGALRGFSDLFGDITRAQGRDGAQIGMLGSFKRGSSGVLTMELQAASEKGRGWMMLGDILNMGAGLTLPNALMAPGASALAPTSSLRPVMRPI